MKKAVTTFLFLLLSVTITALAQESACPDLVQQALDYISNQCSAIERNQACYGNLQVNAVPLPEVTDFKFDQPGDITALSGIQSLSLSALTLPDTWGVMMMSVQADLPDSVPGQNVTLLLFGDVTLENRGGADKAVLLSVTASSNARVRSGPGTQNSQIGSLTAGESVQADGRSEAGDWLRVQLTGGTAGWVSADLVSVEGDAATLAVVETTDIAGTAYGPMQAFYFTSGIGSSDCAGVPQDGMLIQTPAGAGKVNLLINEVQVEVGSTVYMTAQPAAEMSVAVLEGGAAITAGGTTVNIPAGAVATLPLDENGLPAGAPELAGYDAVAIDPLTTLLPVLPETITPAEPVNLDELVLAPRSGNWLSSTGASSMSCSIQGAAGSVAIPASSASMTMEFTGDSLVTTAGQGVLPPPIPSVGMNTYSVTYTVENDVSVTITLQVISPEEMTGSMVMSGPCSATIPLTLTYQGG